MTTASTKELRLDSTDLRWLSERIDSLDTGNITVHSATLKPEYLATAFKVKRVDAHPEDGDGGRLVLALRVAA